jgi:hypothetical protein
MATEYCNAMEVLRPKGFDESAYGGSYKIGKNWTPGLLVFLGIWALFIAWVYTAKPTWFQYKVNGVPNGQINPWLAILIGFLAALLIGWLFTFLLMLRYTFGIKEYRKINKINKYIINNNIS